MAESWPDVEALVVEQVTGFDMTVQQVGGTAGRAHAQATHLLQLDVRAATKAKARADAYAALDAVIALQRSHPATVGKVAATQLPTWLPEPDGQPRYVATVTATNRTNRDVTYPT